MTTDTLNDRRHARGLARRLTLAAVLLLACAASLTWSWNTIVPELTGLARIRFAEGFSIALTLLLAGALFEAGRRLLGAGAPASDRARQE